MVWLQTQKSHHQSAQGTRAAPACQALGGRMTTGTVWGSDLGQCQPPGFKSQPCYLHAMRPQANSNNLYLSFLLPEMGITTELAFRGLT